MEKISIALVGAGGYGRSYLNFLKRYIDPQTYVFAGIIDPYVDRTQVREWLKSQDVPPIYNSLEDFYADSSAELVIVSTPVRFHKEHSITAMAHGSHVLCEKPLVPIIQDALELKQAQEKYNRHLGVGFQLSYSKPILDLKTDILNDEFGKPLEFKSFSSWRRHDSYYQESDWKGRIRSKTGEWILDAVSTNATAHYLFNMFFMAGDRLETSKTPVKTEVEIYKAKDIETYDTCFMRGVFDNGCRFFYFSTHSGDREVNPSFLYIFEKATASMKWEDGKYNITVSYNDGRVKNYGDAMSGENSSLKITAMMAAARGEGTVLCGIDTVMPHIVISNAVFDQAPFSVIPKSVCYRTENPSGTFVHNLVDEGMRCYETMKLPSESGYSWAASPTELVLEGYTAFSGDRFL